MLEIHTLKQHLNTTRQELTHALYQHEAACRVVTRIIKERDEAREELAKIREAMKGGVAVAEQAKGITEDLVDKFNELSEQLSQSRKGRKVPEDVAKENEMEAFHESLSASLHPAGKDGKAGVTCMDLNNDDPSLILTGGKDGTAHLFDSSANKILSTFTHKAKVTAVSFVPADLLTAITCSADSTAKYFAL